MEKLSSDFENELNEIVELAKANRSEDWEIIDRKLPQLSNSEIFLNWARGNLGNEDSGLRDLAASVLENANCNLNSTDISALKRLMQESDGNPYPSFRAACALAKRSDNPEIKGFIEEIRNKLQQFAEDEGVADLAKNYLERLKN